MLFTLLPPEPAATVRDILAQTEQRAGAAGLVMLLVVSMLLLASTVAYSIGEVLGSASVCSELLGLV
jgi:hypothetical protein